MELTDFDTLTFDCYGTLIDWESGIFAGLKSLIHKPASEFDLASCWISRRHSQPGFGAIMNPGWQPNVAFRFNSMADFAKAHQQAVAKK